MFSPLIFACGTTGGMSGYPNILGPQICCPTSVGSSAPDATGDGADAKTTPQPVVYADGQAVITATDIESLGFGMPWSQGRTYDPIASNYTTGLSANGNNWTDTDTPHIVEATAGSTATLIVVSKGTNTEYFDLVGSVYVAENLDQNVLTYDSGTNTYTLSDSAGGQTSFFDFGSGVPNLQKGEFEQYSDPAGNLTTATYAASGDPAVPVGRLKSIDRHDSGSVASESWVYQYTSTSSLANVSEVQWFQNGSGTATRQVVYTYYTGATGQAGNSGDLESATVEDGASNVLSVDFYCYYTTAQVNSGSNAYVGALKYVLSYDSYTRVIAAGLDPSLSATSISSYADNYFEYYTPAHDGGNSAILGYVMKEIAQGPGCSCTGSNGQGVYLFSYTPNTNFGYSPDSDEWAMKTSVQFEDPFTSTLLYTETVYTNDFGETILDATTDNNDSANPSLDGENWGTFYKYDTEGRILWTAEPSALSLPSSLSTLDSYNDVLDSVGGNYAYINDDRGLIYGNDFYSSTSTSDTTTPGGVEGYFEDSYILQGDMDMTPIVQEKEDYFAHTYSPGGGVPDATIYPIADDTLYGSNGGDARVTSYDYVGWYAKSGHDTNQPTEIITSLPVISSGQNGSGSANMITDDFDIYGRVVSETDADGFITTTQYDDGSDAVTQTVQDSGGLNLTTNYVVDGLGRTTEETDPNGKSTFTVYNDAQFEVRVYSGWNSTTHTATGPIQISRTFYPTTSGQQLYVESITSSATPTYDAITNDPTGAETIDETNIQSLSRSLTDTADQVVEEDDYFSLAGVTYSPTAMTLGSTSSNYSATIYGYDGEGNQDKVESANGTITRTVYDNLGRVSSIWVGTDDIPTSGGFSPANTAGTNMVDVQDNTYDQAYSLAAPPSAVSLSQSTLVSLPAATYYVELTYVGAGGETLPSFPGALSVSADNRLDIASPVAETGMTGYNIYVSTTSGQEILQGTEPIGTDWHEPLTGLGTSGSSPPSAVGDSNLTQTVQHPGGGAADRVTEYLYDSRDWLVATKSSVLLSSGVPNPSGETDNAHRPITYTELDNLGETVATYQYDGDGVSLTDFASDASDDLAPTGVDAGKLRAESAASYDDQGRVYQTQVYSVDQGETGGTAGTVGNALASNMFYDNRGDLVATFTSGAPTTKAVFDGADRPIAEYETDGGILDLGASSALSWANATTVSHDVVFSETDTAYDETNNAIYVTNKERFDNAAGTAMGALGALDSRDSYASTYYDDADRPLASVDVGTNGGSAYSPPSSPPGNSANVKETDYGYLADNVQVVSLTGSPTGGSYTLKFGGQTTASIDFEANAATVMADLEALTSIGAGNVSVTGGCGGPYTVRFIGSLAGATQPIITVASSSLTGGSSPAVSIVIAIPGGDAGMAQSSTDPLGHETFTDYDLLGRTIDTIAAFTDGVPTNDTNQTTAYTYDGDGNTLTQTAVLPDLTSTISSASESGTTVTVTTSAAHGYAVGQTVTVSGASVAGYNGQFTITAVPTATTFKYTAASGLGSATGGSATVNQVQTTAYTYGVGSSGKLYSNDLLATVSYPDKATGLASNSSANQQSYSYDDLGEQHTFTDQNGTTHTYTYDVLGRLTLDAATTIGSGVVNSVKSLGYSFDTGGRLYQATSYANNNGTSVVNQVEDLYNGLGQLVTEYQEHNGAVNTATSANTRYTYSDPSTGALQTSMSYTNGRTIDDGYGGQSAIVSISHSGTTATVTTATPTGLLNGSSVTISGASQSVYNGTFTITVTSPTTFTYTTATTPGSNASGDDMMATGEPVIGVTSITRSGTTATVTTAEPLSLSAGVSQIVISGASDPLYDGTFTVASVTNSTTFTYTMAGTPANNASGTDMTLQGTTPTLDGIIGRLTAQQDHAAVSGVDTAGAVLEAYSYLGLGTIVQQTRPQPGVDLSLIQQNGDTLASSDGGDRYTGLDRFGEVIDQNWVNPNTDVSTDRFQYGYDADGNVLYKNNLVNSSQSELYHASGSGNGYDLLNRITGFVRGTLSASGGSGTPLDTVTNASINTAANSDESWTLDALGNWISSATGAGTGSATAPTLTTTNRTTNSQNELTKVGAHSLSYNNNGDMTVDNAGYDYTYDAWGHLPDAICGTSGTQEFKYDALGREISETPILPGGCACSTHDFYYSQSGQLIEEKYIASSTSFSSPGCGCACGCCVSGAYYTICTTSADEQYVHGQGYVDDLTLRDDSETFSVTTEFEYLGSFYSPSTSTSSPSITRVYAEQDANYNVTSLVSTSGSTDARMVYDPYGTENVLSMSLPGPAVWVIGFQGGRTDSFSGPTITHFGARDYEPGLGRWIEPDGGYWDGVNLYQTEDGGPVGTVDPYGNCFAAETRILMADGTFKLIGEVKPDDCVLAVPDISPESTPRACRVIEVYHNAPAKLIHIYIEGETIRSTPNHPFFVKGKGWIHAETLAAGDRLRTAEQSWVDVDSVECSEEVEQVFNLHIDQSHTYFVQSSLGTAVLVHNNSLTSLAFSTVANTAGIFYQTTQVVSALTSDAIDFTAQAAGGYVEANVPKPILNITGVKLVAPTSTPGRLGRQTGRAAAAVQAAGEIVCGGGGDIGGFALDATGGGAIVGIPVNVISTLVLIDGVWVAVNVTTLPAVGGSGSATTTLLSTSSGPTPPSGSGGSSPGRSGTAASQGKQYLANPQHAKGTNSYVPGKEPEPCDAAEVFKNSIGQQKGNKVVYWGQSTTNPGVYYRFFKTQGNIYHFSGSTLDPQTATEIPGYIIEELLGDPNGF